MIINLINIYCTFAYNGIKKEREQIDIKNVISTSGMRETGFQ